MSRRDYVGARLRRALHLACTLAVGVMLAAPMLFGPAAAWAMRAVGGEPEHQCACGMTRGKCGCPECADLEHARTAARRSHAYPVLKSTCDDDDPPVPGATPLPRGTMPSPLAVISPPGDPAPRLPAPDTARPRGREKPPTPPPRRIAA